MTPKAAHHLGVLCPPPSSHVAVFVSVAKRLTERGCRVTFLNIPDVEPSVRAAGFSFCPIGETDHPKGSFPAFLAEVNRRQGLSATAFMIRTALRETRMILRDAPARIRTLGISALLVDQGELGGSTVAEINQIPFITVCNATPNHCDPTTPPSFVAWPYDLHPLARLRTSVACQLSNSLLKLFLLEVNRFRRQYGLPPIHQVPETYSKLAQISQLTKELDFPTRRLSKHFHYIGLFEKTPSRNVPFPFEKLNGKPVVYASMGTMFGRHAWIFREIAEACAPLNVQLVMTAGGAGNAGELQLLPGSPLAVDYAPQMDILARSRLAISHGGLNTILESLVSGVPMIAVPLYTDQPGNAARLRRSGAGDFIMPGSLTAARLRGLIQKMLESTSYQERANEQRNSIIKAGGSKHAADIIVQALDHEIRS